MPPLRYFLPPLTKNSGYAADNAVSEVKHNYFSFLLNLLDFLLEFDSIK